MSELTLLLVKIGVLALLWLFLALLLGTMRRELRMAERVVTAAPDAVTRVTRPRRGRRGGPAKLVVTGGDASPAEVSLAVVEQVSVGRGHDNTVIVDDEYTSTRHARFFQHGQVWFIEDLQSTNGTWIDSSRLLQPSPIEPGMVVRIGKVTLELQT